MAVDSFAKGKTYAQRTACRAIWADVWKIVEELEHKGVSLHMFKIKAHTDDDQLAPLPQRLGNQCADHHARLAVAEPLASEVASIRWKDGKQRAIQERMILAIQILPWRGRHPQEVSTLTEGDTPQARKNPEAVQKKPCSTWSSAEAA